MYISRMKLDTRNRNTLRALYTLERLHGALESAFPGERKRHLWRLDRLNGNMYLLLISEDAPNLRTVCEQFSASPDDWETKSYDELLHRIQNGTNWMFRLTANPTKAMKNHPDACRGKVKAITIPDLQKEWLQKRSEQFGFQINSMEVTESKWVQFYKSKQKKPVSLLSVSYEGILTVTDEALFRQVMVCGIGREKAYGMGMLTVMHI